MSNVPSDFAAFDSLRTEIVEAQKARTDLMKYKLVVTAVLGAAAIGIGPAYGAKQVPYIIGIVPLVCLYVDAVCHHNDIRMLVIGRYMRWQGFRYEALAEQLRGMFKLERVALDWSSFALGGGLFVTGVTYWLFERSDADLILVLILIASGAFGVSATWLVHHVHQRSMRSIASMSADEIANVVATR